LETVFEKRFKVTKLQTEKRSYSRFEIHKDLQTGVLYYFIASSSGKTITPLLDVDGKPLVDKSE